MAVVINMICYAPYRLALKQITVEIQLVLGPGGKAWLCGFVLYQGKVFKGSKGESLQSQGCSVRNATELLVLRNFSSNVLSLLPSLEEEKMDVSLLLLQYEALTSGNKEADAPSR